MIPLRATLALVLAAAGQDPAEAPTPTAPPRDQRPPNVLFVLSDEHRWHSMGHTEMPELATPNLDRLAAEGVSFRTAIANYPLCSPARAILLTGRWPHRTGVLDNGYSLVRGEKTVARAFLDAGYRTGYVGKWHLGRGRVRASGFERAYEWAGNLDHWKSRYTIDGGGPVQHEGRYTTSAMTDQALALMEGFADEPFFLMLSWNTPHFSYGDAPEAWRERYPPGALAPRGNVGGAWDEEAMYAGYHAHVAALDVEIGRLLAKLEELELERDTIVVYTSDHGGMLGSHGKFGKRSPHDESIRVPFLVRWPGGVPPAPACARLFGHIDVAPTLLGLAGLDPLPTFAGQDFSPLLRAAPQDRAELGPNPEVQFTLQLQLARYDEDEPVHPAFRGLRTRRYTYAVTAEGPWLLFDDEADPLQLENLVDAPEQAELRERFDGLLADWMASSGAGF